MEKKLKSSLIIRDAKTGRFVTVQGAGALKGSKFAISKSVDLTKPIAKQALKAREGRGPSKTAA